MLTTHMGGAARTIGWIAMEVMKGGRPCVLGAITGAVAGLATITPASGFVSPMSGIIIGLMAGVVCYFMCATVKIKYGYDDSLDVFGVHGMGGLTGTLLAGIFASSAVNDIYDGSPVGLIEGNAGHLVNQVVASVAAIVFTLALTWIILKVTDMTVALRLSEESEVRGMDHSIHGEEGYVFELE